MEDIGNILYGNVDEQATNVELAIKHCADIKPDCRNSLKIYYNYYSVQGLANFVSNKKYISKP